jgi:hypothetical protein
MRADRPSTPTLDREPHGAADALGRILDRLADGPDALVGVWATQMQDADCVCSNTVLVEK